MGKAKRSATKTPKTTSSVPAVRKPSGGLTDEERTAMKERAKELKRGDQENSERALLAKIAEMPEPDRSMAERLHAMIRASVPMLSPTTWYGMPAYAKDGKVVCFFQSSAKFKTRYATLGFTDRAQLDDGTMWPTSFALVGLGPTEEAKIAALLNKAVG